MSLDRRKDEYIKILSQAEKYTDGYKLENLDVQEIKEDIEKFKVTVPIVGGFSSGKSTIINKILDDKILATDIVATTAIPTQLNFNEYESIEVKKEGNWRKIDREELKKNEFDMKTTEVVQVNLNNPFLKSIESIKIVDIPGLDSGIEEHNTAIDKYILNSLAYIVSVDVEQGFRKSVMDFLEELKLYDVPVLIILTKTDKKTNQDVEDIYLDIKDKVENKLKIQDYSIGMTSSRNGEIEPVKTYLKKIQEQSQELFEKKYSREIKSVIKEIENYLRTRIENKDFSIEEIEEKEKELEKEIKDILNKIHKEDVKFLDQSKNAIQAIKNKLKMELENSAEAMSRDLINNRDINNKINNIVRRSITNGIKTEIEPKLQKYFKNISNIIDDQFNIDSEIEVDEMKLKMNKFMEETIKKSIPAIVAGIGAFIGGPIGAILGGIAALFVESIFSKMRREQKLIAAEEKIRNEIIPQVVSESEHIIEEQILSYTEEISEEISILVNKEKEAKEKSLEDLKTQKQLKLEEQKSIVEKLELELLEVRELYGRI